MYCVTICKRERKGEVWQVRKVQYRTQTNVMPVRSAFNRDLFRLIKLADRRSARIVIDTIDTIVFGLGLERKRWQMDQLWPTNYGRPIVSISLISFSFRPITRAKFLRKTTFPAERYIRIAVCIISLANL